MINALFTLVSLAKLRLGREEGATMVEYGLIVVFIAVVVGVAATALGLGISDLFNQVDVSVDPSD